MSDDEEIQTWECTQEQKKSELLRVHAASGFTELIYAVLAQEESLLIPIADQLLEDHFPNSLHDRILAAIGLEVR
ncbi:MAG: hypothetical protein AB7G75_16465 [Candidatus Binatia bacterium]